MKVNKIKLIIIVIILALIIMLIPLLKCEIITFYHKDEFKECIKYSELFDYDSLIIKIIEYGDTNASVYCYSLGNYCSGDLLTFKKDKNNNWQIDEWDSLWSDSGNADKTVWPYWWHFIYFI